MDDDRFYKTIADHVITPVTETDEVQAYYLHKPGEGGVMDSRMMSTFIVFTPEGIVITGDLAPKRHGTIGSFGYGRNWFTGNLNGRYLASKFCIEDNHYDEDRARREFEEWKREHLEDDAEYYGELVAKIDAAVEDWHFENRWTAHEFFSEYLDDYYEFAFGVGYDEVEYGWLIAIQKRFAEAWRERTAVKEGV